MTCELLLLYDVLPAKVAGTICKCCESEISATACEALKRQSSDQETDELSRGSKLSRLIYQPWINEVKPDLKIFAEVQPSNRVHKI